ncbi:sodium- and chloride-dependent GABA transporter 2-like [Actinia tenebrosa]|uniref:Transporter n=1 Tax=Actinia tenebrosa TaxID=6105 RepID=A0A6P8IXA0_ACTTE|nr:sodium- and chloride-dependent GABA transporter 2-like [Actinia tenebrosa]
MVAERETWVGKLDFILALIGFSVGLGNIWRFPYLCYKNGGGCFLIPYAICLFVAGVPLLILEVCLGQFMSQGGITAWKICPIFQGIGCASVVIVQYLNIYYIVILGWAFFYMFHSFTAVLPWSHCGNKWNTAACFAGKKMIEVNVTINGTFNGTKTFEDNSTVSPIVEFWNNRVLNISNGLDEVGSINWEMALCLLLSWIVCYLCVWKGVKSTGRVVYFTATFPYVLLTIICVRAVTLPGAATGIKYYLLPDWSKLQQGQVWLDAATQVFFSYSIGLGTLVALGSYNKFKNNCYRDCIIFACVNSGTSFYGGFVIFSVLGFMAEKQGVSVGDVAESGPGLAFIAYPAAVAEMPISPLWSILFFFMVILLGLDSEFVGVEGFVTAIVDMFPGYLRRGYRKEIFIGVMSTFWFFMGLFMVTEGGMYVFQLFDNYSASGSALLWVSLFESIGIGWIYGAERFYQNIQEMIGFRINPWLKMCWIFFTPVFCLAIFIFTLVTYEPLVYNKTYKYPAWGEAIGWCLAMSSIICVPVVAIINMMRASGDFIDRLRVVTTPVLPPGRGVPYADNNPLKSPDVEKKDVMEFNTKM